MRRREDWGERLTCATPNLAEEADRTPGDLNQKLQGPEASGKMHPRKLKTMLTEGDPGLGSQSCPCGPIL